MPQLSAYLSADAMAGWKRLSRDTGATVTGLVEAVGRAMAAGRFELSAEIIAVAREVDTARRTRRPPAD